MTPLQHSIIGEIYAALEKLGADRFVLGAVGSWGDTLDDAEVLEILRRWNRGERIFDQVIASTTDKGPRLRRVK